MRTWALAEPATYALLFGSPVPGYPAPAERTTGPGTRVIDAAGARCWEDAMGRPAAVSVPTRRRVSTSTRCLATWPRHPSTSSGSTAPDACIARGVLVWAALFGCVSFEVFGQYGPDTFTQPQDLFEHQLEVLAETVGLG